MNLLSKDAKLLTLSLLLRTMPKNQQSLLLGHLSPDIAQKLMQIEQETSIDVEKLDWTPFYQSWPELQKILESCKQEINIQKANQVAEEQRPKIREYILTKTGRGRRGSPVFLSPEITKIIDGYLDSLKAI